MVTFVRQCLNNMSKISREIVWRFDRYLEKNKFILSPQKIYDNSA